ncbi:MAG: hypothetical protein ACK4GL_00595 [Flavobacteriales bacterium]
MTKKAIFTSAVLMAVFNSLIYQGCKRLDRLVSFNLSVEHQFAIPVFPDSVLTDAFIGNETFSYLLNDLRFSNEDEFEKNRTFPTRVESVEIQSIGLTIDSGAVATFNRMKKIDLFIVSGVTQEQLIGTVENIQNNQTNVTFLLNITKEQFKDVINRDAYKLRLVIEWSAGIDEPVYLKLRKSFRLKAIPNDD